MLLNSSQISKLFDSFIRITNFSASGSSNVVTTAISNSLTTAGEGGVSVPLQAATTSTLGVVTNATLPIFDNVTKRPLRESVTNNEIYAKITEASGVYTASYFYLSAIGVETVFNFGSATSVDILFPYRFDFYRVPANFATAYPIGDINLPNVGSTNAAKWVTEKLNVTATNTVSALAKTPTANTNVFLIVNGKHENAFGGGSAAFSVATKTITWSAVNAGYSLLTTFDVVAFYETLE